MKFTKMTYDVYQNAYQLDHGDLELIAIADVGPRVLCLRRKGGPNLLFEDKLNKYTRKDWRLYGGHRFWVGPETEHAFTPENSPCRAFIEQDCLSIEQPADAMGLQRTLIIKPHEQEDAFILRHVVRNVGRVLFTGTIWTLSCLLPHRVLIPWGAGSDKWQGNMVRYWTYWDGHHTDPASSLWEPHKDYFLVHAGSQEEGKIGLYSERGFLALLRGDGTFIKTYRPSPEATYPDGGCNIEVYSCADFAEMETLSPVYTFYPGCEYVHEEQWAFLKHTFEPDQWLNLRANLAQRDLLTDLWRRE